MGPSRPFDHRIESPILIGRVPALAALEHALDQARTEYGQTCVLAGEAGVGKSRLVAEAKARAQAVPGEMRVLEGHCFEPDRVLPYAPILDLLRTFFIAGSAADIAHDLGPTAHELVKLLPELATILSDLVATPTLDPEQEKHRLFQALTQFFTRLAAHQPLLVIVEDLHWSDDTGLEFLLHLARRIASHPILLLLTYRNEEVHAGLNHFLAELDREHLATELTLPPLTITEAEAMIRAIFDLPRPVRAEFLEPVYNLTEGNPFFIEEVLKSLVAAGEIFRAKGGWDRKSMSELHIPRSIQDAVRRRLEHISPAAGDILVIAAAAGRRFDFMLLQELTKMPEHDLLQLLKEAIAVQLVVEESADQFAFRHALTQEAIYRSLLIRERRLLHRFVAETLERQYAGSLDPHVADLAYHFFQAQAWEKVLAYAQRAGEKAQAMYAPRVAIEQFARALEAADQLSLRPPPQLYRARGQAYETLGEFERARADYEAALEAARILGDRQAEWQALIDLGFLWASRDYVQTGDYFQSALALARTLDDPAILGQSLNRLGNWYTNIEQPLEGLRCHQEALGIFEELNDRRGLAQTLDLLGIASYVSGDVSQGTAYYERAVALFRELDDRQGLVSSLGTLALGSSGNYEVDTLVTIPSSPDAVREAESTIKLADEIGWRSGEAYNLIGLAECLGWQGDYARGLDLARAGLAIAEEIQHRQWMTFAHYVLGAVYLDLLALPAARRHLEQALALAQEIGSWLWIRMVTGSLAGVYTLQHEPARAESILDAALAEDSAIQTIGQRVCWCARAELALARGDAALALQITDRLLASAANLSEERVIPRLWKLRGAALIAMHRMAEAEDVLCEARAGALTQGARPLLWRIHLSLGKLYRSRRLFEAAEGEFSAARAVIEELAAGVPDEDLRQNFLLSALAGLPHPSSSSRRAAKREFGGLTAREREVAALVGQGRSNREVADALVVSERTVEKHVSNILGKLGLDSRAQMIAWALEKGLARSQPH